MKRSLKRKAALVIGLSIIIMAVAAGIAYGAIHSSLIIVGNENETLKNISINLFIFYIEIILWIAIIILDLLVCWGVWIYFRTESKALSISTGILRLIYTIILSIAVYMLLQVSIEINLGSNGNVISLISSFEKIWSKGLIIFGVHLIILGFAAFKETKLWGILLIIAGVSYSLIHGVDSFLPKFKELKNILETILVIPMTVGELGFGIWLLVKGGRSIKSSS